MKHESFRQVFAFTVLFITVGWAVFVVFVVQHATDTGQSPDILASAGATGLLGALIAWTADIKQFFFRKSKPDEPDEPDKK